MKRTTFFWALMLSVVLLAGCSKDEETTEPEPEKVTYSVTYSVKSISDDFFTLGSFIMAYTDKEGKEQYVEFKKPSQIPFTVTVEGLNADAKLYFDLVYGYRSDVELTKEQYTFQKEASLIVKGSDGSMHSSTLATGSLTVGKDKIKAYLEKAIEEENQFESTIKEFIKN